MGIPLKVLRSTEEPLRGIPPETLNHELRDMEAKLAGMMVALILKNPYIKVKPFAKQVRCLLAPQKEILYGGAAGGGKSYALLTAALMYVHVKGYSALILRRTFRQLSISNGLIEMSHEWLDGTDAKWREVDKTWTFPSGATLQFGHMEHENSKLSYQGSGYDFIGFDELTFFTETQYTYMFRSSGRRSDGFGAPQRIYSTANPGGIGHDWVKSRFIDAKPTKDLLYIISTYKDNPHINHREYEKSLDQLPPILRAQQKDGNWDAKPEGKMFKYGYFNYIEYVEIPWDDIDVVRFWDKASTEQVNNNDPDYTAGILLGVGRSGTDSNGLIYVLDLVHGQFSPSDTLNQMGNTAKMDGKAVPVRDEQEMGASGKLATSMMARDIFKGYDYAAIRPQGNKATRATPFARQAALGHVYLVRGVWNSTLVNEFISFPTKGVHDDIVDAVSGAYNFLVNYVDDIKDSPDTTPTAETIAALSRAKVKGNKVKAFELR